MTLTADSAEVLEAFDALCKLVSAGRGLTMAQLRDCYALARELEKKTPDSELVAGFCAKLEIDPEELK